MTNPNAKHRSILCLLLTLVLCFAMIPQGQATSDIEQITQNYNPIVRVYLSRLGIEDRMDLTLNQAYGITLSNGNALYFPQSSTLSFLLQNGQIYLYYENMSMSLGTDITLTAYANENTTGQGFCLTNYSAQYWGDLRLSVSDGILKPILSIHVEDYLLGVVPYEMSDSFPVEALKAQAIAARTYALRKQDAQSAYDVVDTTNDQVYKGYLEGYTNVEQAVSETEGICGFYQGSLAQCYYSASNGGQTELVESVWPTDADFSYYAFGADPYDVQNPASTVLSLTLSKQANESETAPYSVRTMLAEQLSDELSALGFDASAESVRLDEVHSVILEEPNQADSILYTQLQMSIKISGRTRSDIVIYDTSSTTQDADSSAVPTATASPIYGDWTVIDEVFTLSMPIFPTAEDAFLLDISSNFDNEIWSVVETDDTFVVEARRYGHGVGMSQRGAEWMALNYQKSYEEILAFYYPGMELKQYVETPTTDLVADSALSMTAGPAPSPTPRPTVMPTTLTPTGDQYLAMVSNIEEDSTLNLRQEPNLNADIVMRLQYNQTLLVLSTCPEDGWVEVQTDVVTGYVMEKYLTTISE